MTLPEAPALFPVLATSAAVVWLAWSQRKAKQLPCPSCKWSDGGCPNKLPAPDCGAWEQWRVDYD